MTTKTQPELAKWAKRVINAHWFKVDTMKITAVSDPENWRADFQTARKENSEAFAGQHEAGSTSFYVFDESSGVPDELHEVSEGGLTDGEPMKFCFGNRTRPTGWFNSLFGKFKHRWWTMCVDSRDAKMTNKQQIQEWAEDWGEDSDFFRVRVMGLPPSAAAEQLIPIDWIAEARKREAAPSAWEPLVLGVDVARFGDDDSVIVYRQGNDARSIPSKRMRGWSTVQVAEQVNADIMDMKPQAVFVDGGGVGGGVVDILRRMGHTNVIEVNFGGKSRDKEFLNKRSEMWGKLRVELGRQLAIPDEDKLEEELAQQEYQINRQTRQTMLVSKEDMRRLGIPSPDWGDALALTYAQPVPYAGETVQTQAIME